MKVCNKCGAYNSDDRKFCVDCDEKLDSLVDNQEKFLEQQVEDKIDKLYNKNDPLYVSVFDKIVGGLSLMGVVATIVVFILNAVTQTSCEGLGWAFIAFVLSSFEAFCPQLNWELEKMRLSFKVSSSSDLEPSNFYLFARKAAIIISLLLGIMMLIINLLQ